MPADGVDLLDAGAGSKQGAGYELHVLESHSSPGRGHKGRAAAGDATDQQVIFGYARDEIQGGMARHEAARIGNRMPGLHRDHTVASRRGYLLGDEKGIGKTWQRICRGQGHGFGGLANPQEKEAVMRRQRRPR